MSRVILVEGPSDELVLKRYYLDTHKKLPEDDGIEIIVVRGLGFDTYLEILRRIGVRTNVVKDNDGDYETNIKGCRDEYKDSTRIRFFSPEENSLNSLEPALIAEYSSTTDSLDFFAKLVLTSRTYGEYAGQPDLAARVKFLRNWFNNGKKKVDSAMRIFEGKDSIVYPDYIKGSFDFA